MDLEKYPELARKGAYSPSEKYTEDEIKALIVYAGEVSLSGTRSSYLVPWSSVLL